MGKLLTNKLHLKQSIFWSWTARLIFLILILLIFFFSIDLMIRSLAFIARGTAKDLINVAENPYITFFIGLLTTALIQSSSTITSMGVAIVASGTISLSSGVFLIMGANIGTTLTSNIVALGYITNRSEFRKAVSAATVHDFFNILTAIIVFPLEYSHQFLSKSAIHLAGLFGIESTATIMEVGNLNIFFLSPITEAIVDFIGNVWIVLIISVLLLFLSIKLFSYLSYKSLIGESRDKLKHYIFSNPLKSFIWGVLFTGALQSSSITTSLMVPLVATRKVILSSAFPFIMGANIGTTITALLAGLIKSEAALSLALAHLMFNLIGVTIFLPFSSIRAFPEFLAKNLGYYASNQRLIGFFYIIVTFFIIPFFLIYLSK